MIARDQLRLLLVEDDPHDLFFLRLALEKAGMPAPVAELRDGASAIAFFQTLAASGRQLPHIVVMDLKMPRVNGDEVLKWLRDHAHYHDLPVIVLTSSDDTADIRKTGRLGILKFLTKEVHGRNLVAVLEKFMADAA